MNRVSGVLSLALVVVLLAEVAQAAIEFNVWTALSPSPGPTSEAAFVYDDSQFFYLMGGYVGGSGADRHHGSDRFLRYDRNSDVWESIGAVPVPMYSSSAVYLQDGIFVVAGAVYNGDTSHLFFRYDVASGAWCRLSDVPNPQHYVEGGSGATATDGQRYIYTSTYDEEEWQAEGLRVGEHFVRYDTESDEWESLSDPPLHSAGHALVYANGALYKIGGSTINGSGSVPIIWRSAVQRYDVAMDRWEVVGSAPEPIASTAAAYDGMSGAIYVTNVLNPSNPLYLYKPSIQAWKKLGEAPGRIDQALWAHRSMFATGGRTESGGSLYRYFPAVKR